jgi:hypothetical protein
MSLYEGMQRKFASHDAKLIRICKVTGNVEKMEKIWTNNPKTRIEKIKQVGQYSRYDF